MKKFLFVMLSVYTVAAAYMASLCYIETLAHIPPAAEKKSLSAIADKAAYTEADYRFIFEQTGLGRAAVDSPDRVHSLSEYRDSYFADLDYTCKMNSPVSYEERVVGEGALLAPLEDGDVLVTNSSHVFSWRNGHAAIVINAAEGVTLEAVVIGKNSGTQTIGKWRRYPNFAVLRLKGADSSERAAVARSAEKYLCDIPYHAAIGLFPMKYSSLDAVSGTQCAHLVWLAYAAHGYDIDSDGGLIVTPKDILESGLFEVVQTYGQMTGDD